jgi:hypothetical protein
MKILYDTFFKTIFNPDDHPERLKALLSVILGKKIKSIRRLNNESIIFREYNSILFFDIIVVLDDGSIVNVEMQKHGFKYPGQRAACYCSDLVIRQYTNIRKKDKKANYLKLKPAFTIVFLEKSPGVFHSRPDNYLHHFSQRSDTGLDLPLLQNYIFIPLDIFSEIIETKDIKDRNPLESWLTFLCTEDPEDIEQLIRYHPEFKPLYEDLFGLCRNMEGVTNMFASQLDILDRNTFTLMYDELEQECITAKQERDAAEQERDAAEQERDAAKQELNLLLLKNDALMKYIKDAGLEIPVI